MLQKATSPMFGQMLVMRLFLHHNLLSQMCEAVMETVHSSASFWSDALHLAQPAVRV
jgi:ornithine--oxo-acid transaminase